VPIFSTLIFGMMRWAARKGLRGERDNAPAEGSFRWVERELPRGS
jgi:hypothetical protein